MGGGAAGDGESDDDFCDRGDAGDDAVAGPGPAPHARGDDLGGPTGGDAGTVSGASVAAPHKETDTVFRSTDAADDGRPRSRGVDTDDDRMLPPTRGAFASLGGVASTRRRAGGAALVARNASRETDAGAPPPPPPPPKPRIVDAGRGRSSRDVGAGDDGPSDAGARMASMIASGGPLGLAPARSHDKSTSSVAAGAIAKRLFFKRVVGRGGETG